MLNILIRAVLALILAAALTNSVVEFMQPLYPVGEAAAFVISYVILLLLLIRPSHMSDAAERNLNQKHDFIIDETFRGDLKPYSEWYSVDREDPTGP